MGKLRILWVDLTVSLKEADIPPEFRKYSEVRSCTDVQSLDLILSRHPVDLVCFDFDFPDRAGLRLLWETKLAFPSLPALMLTVQHSESLAIWSFRTKIWDYLVKPIPRHEVERCLTALLRALDLKKNQRSRRTSMHGHRIPEEVSYSPRLLDSSLAPAIFYVEKYFRSKIRSDDVASTCRMSPFRFSRVFKDSFGMTFRDYVVAYRLREACRLLENPTTSVSDVAYAVGFNDASYFSRMFKQRVGLAPSLVLGRPISELRKDAEVAALPELPKIVV